LFRAKGGVNNDLSESTGERCEPTSNEIRSNEIRPDTPGLRSHQPGSGKSRNYISETKFHVDQIKQLQICEQIGCPCGQNPTDL
jgi:hypothetical protein